MNDSSLLQDLKNSCDIPTTTHPLLGPLNFYQVTMGKPSKVVTASSMRIAKNRPKAVRLQPKPLASEWDLAVQNVIYHSLSQKKMFGWSFVQEKVNWFNYKHQCDNKHPNDVEHVENHPVAAGFHHPKTPRRRLTGASPKTRPEIVNQKVNGGTEMEWFEKWQIRR